MAETHWTDQLVRLHACVDAVQWARGYPDLASAWAACPRGDWMLWLATRVSGWRGSVARRRAVRTACACTRLALPLWEEMRYLRVQRARAAIEATEAYCDGAATLDDVRTAAAAAEAAAYSAPYARAATYAYAAHAASVAAAVAVAVANAAASVVAIPATLAQCADLVRRHFPEPPRITQEAHHG